jgi:hypothetical protein
MFVTDVPELKPLGDDLAVLAELDPHVLGGQELTELVVGYLAVRDRLAAIGARFVAAYVARRAWAADGSKSPAIHLARQRGEPVDGVRNELRVGRALARMPVTAAAFAAGAITRAHVDRLIHAAGNGRDQVFADAEGFLVDAARTLSGFSFDHAVRAWVLAADDHGSPRDPHIPDPTRWLERHRGYDGRYRLDVQFDRPGGAEFVATLDHIERELFHADWARARARLGRQPVPSELERTPTQRRHDAAVTMARRAAAAPPGARLPVPLITVILGEDRFRDLCELATAPPSPSAKPSSSASEANWNAPCTPRRPASRSGNEPVPSPAPPAARSRSATAPAPSQPPTPAPDGRCHVPADQCEADHIQRVEDGGLTIQPNGQMRCTDHHQGRRHNQTWFHHDRASPDKRDGDRADGDHDGGDGDGGDRDDARPP